MLTNEQMNELFTLKNEIPGVECKSPGSLKDNPLLGRVIRAVIGMANRRDGGIVIVGISERNHLLSYDGLTEEQAATWLYDHLADSFAKYTEPLISFDYHMHIWKQKQFLILHIHEFTDVPILCKNEYFDKSNPSKVEEKQERVLRKGALYARSIHKPETKEVTSAENMRLLLDLATEKRLQKFVLQARLAGVRLSQDTLILDKERFAQQREQWTSQLLQDIQSRGYWMLVVRPERFVQERIDLGRLFSIVQSAAVNFRSHSFPYTEPAYPLPLGEDWVNAEYRTGWVIETWRMYQSGQFLYFGGMLTDWRDQLRFGAKGEAQQGTELSIEETIYRCAEFYAFASRLALGDAFHEEDKIHIEILVSGLQNRALSLNSPKFLPIFRDYVTAAKQISVSESLTSEDLIAQPDELAFQAVQHIFTRFNYHPSIEILQAMRSDIGHL